MDNFMKQFMGGMGGMSTPTGSAVPIGKKTRDEARAILKKQIPEWSPAEMERYLDEHGYRK